MIGEMHNCQWDEETRTLTTADEAKREKEVKDLRVPPGLRMNLDSLQRQQKRRRTILPLRPCTTWEEKSQ